MKILLVSYFNSNNIGDVLISNILSDVVSEKADVIKFDYSKGFCKTTKIGYFFNKLTKCIKFANQSLIKRFITLIFYKIHEFFKWTNFRCKLSISDILIIGGGNMIMDLSEESDSANYFGKYIQIAKKLGKRVFVTSIGIGPFINEDQAKRAAVFINKCDYVTFRDKMSAECLKPYINLDKNKFISIDPVFLLPMRKKVEKKEEKYISINVINSKLIGLSNDEYKKSIEFYAKLAEQIITITGYKVLLFQTELNDYSAVVDVYNLIKTKDRVIVNYIDSIDGLLSLYSNTAILIGTRMHSMIIAYTQNIPIIGLTWQQKITSMFSIIDEKESIFNFLNFSSNIHMIVELCVNKLKNIELEKKRNCIKLDSLKKEFEINNKIIDELIQIHKIKIV